MTEKKLTVRPCRPMRKELSPDKDGHVLLVVGSVDELLEDDELGWVDQ